MTDRTHTQTEVKATVERVVDVQPNAHKWEPEAARAYYHAEVDALVAAAYEVAAQACEEIRQRQIRLSMAEKACFDQEQAILALNPTALTALDRAKREARVGDDWDALMIEARAEAEKAMRKFPQPNYVISKVAEEAGEVVKAAIHCAEGRETATNLRGEIKQTLAMLYRLWIEGDQVHGLAAIRALIEAERGKP